MLSHLIRLFPIIAATLLAMSALAGELGVQRSSAGGVTIAVTPQTPAAGAKTWDFKIVLDTHSQNLSDDLVTSAVLIDESGARYPAVGWDGAGLGGHHREGILRFKPLAQAQKTIELQIARPGEAKPRSFRWQVP